MQQPESYDFLPKILAIAKALSSEHDRWKLYELILLEAQQCCDADGGTLYLTTDSEEGLMLSPVIMRNTSLDISITNHKNNALPDFPLYDPISLKPNNHHIATHCVLSKKTINIKNAHSNADYDINGIKIFDKENHYHTHSILTVPLKNHDERVISVLQLINAHHESSQKCSQKKPGKSIFHQSDRNIIEALSSLVAISIENNTMLDQQHNLLIRLASQIGAGLVGVMYVLDEPSIGLHQRDNERLLKTLRHLRDLGNTVIVVEHDEEAIRTADYVLDIGPGAGIHGGEVVARGTIKDILESKKSLTGKYLSGKERIEIPKQRIPAKDGKHFELKGATGNNLQSVDLKLPVGVMTCVTGVSGSGKSSLVNNTLYPIAATDLNRATSLTPSAYTSYHGMENFDKVVDINQAPIGRTPRSNPATYTGIFTPVRELLAGTQESRARGYKPGRFSFNVKGGRCEACQGDGLIKVEMHFLPDMYVSCDVCHGKRYNRETLEITYKGKNINEILKMTVEDARVFFDAIPSISRKLQTLVDVGLSYICLGQAATTLSGGEAQRVKLSKELSKRDTGQTLYILDEPTTGLHFHDVKQLLAVLHRLRDHGNTVLVIEHNLDVIKTADWIIDLGPEGGSKGGFIIAEGTPEDVAMNKKSYTGHFLKQTLS